MWAPEWVCKLLGQFHPNLRLAWNGEHEKFSLIQLFHNRDAAVTYREFWDDRGPVFSKKGRPHFRDWDPLSYTPIWVIDVDNTRDVFNGKVLKDVKQWARPIASRIYKQAKETSRQIESEVEDWAGEAGDRLYRGAQSGKIGNHAPIVAKKFVEPTRNQRRYRDGELDFSDCKVPPPPPGGYEKYLEKDQGDPDNLGSI